MTKYHRLGEIYFLTILKARKSNQGPIEFGFWWQLPSGFQMATVSSHVGDGKKGGREIPFSSYKAGVLLDYSPTHTDMI